MNVSLVSEIRTKKEVKERLKEGDELFVRTESLFHKGPINGECVLVGPSAYKRMWFSRVYVVNNRITTVIS